MLRYEDMVANTERELGKIAALLGIDATPQIFSQTVQRSSAERLRSLEQMQGEQWVSTKDKRSDIPFVRTAVAGGWRTKLPESSVAEIEAAWAPLMVKLGYELVITNLGCTPEALATGSQRERL